MQLADFLVTDLLINKWQIILNSSRKIIFNFNDIPKIAPHTMDRRHIVLVFQPEPNQQHSRPFMLLW